jgi:Aspartyl protease
MTTCKWFASLVLAATIVSAPAAETHCPGNAASLPFRFVNGQQIVLAVSINHTGPYNFLLDSGTQSTMIDLSLATALHLDTQGAAVVAGLGSRQSASLAQVDLIEVGAHAVANQKVLVYDLENLNSADLHLQGILGDDFLEHFDLLIDNANHLLCLDNSATMCAEVKGPRIPLLARAEGDGGGLLIITARLSAGLRPVRLLLDSEITDPSGERTVPVDSVEELPEAAAEISRELRQHYVLGYSPTHTAASGKWHKVEVQILSSTSEHPLTPAHKKGYYARTK